MGFHSAFGHNPHLRLPRWRLCGSPMGMGSCYNSTLLNNGIRSVLTVHKLKNGIESGIIEDKSNTGIESGLIGNKLNNGIGSGF